MTTINKQPLCCDFELQQAEGTYTIAYDRESELLLACVPDGTDVLHAVERKFRRSLVKAPNPDGIVIERGLFLTQEEDEREVRYFMGPNDRCWLKDCSGTEFFFAVRDFRFPTVVCARTDL